MINIEALRAELESAGYFVSSWYGGGIHVGKNEPDRYIHIAEVWSDDKIDLRRGRPDWPALDIIRSHLTIVPVAPDAGRVTRDELAEVIGKSRRYPLSVFPSSVYGGIATNENLAIADAVLALLRGTENDGGKDCEDRPRRVIDHGGD